MAKKIDTYSKEWCELVFKNRNKNYGAYRMRRTSSKRHILAFGVVLLIFSFISYLPTLIDMIEFYIFQHTDSDYVIEDYKFITDNLTEVELMQMSKQFIPNPASKSKPKPVITEEQIKKARQIKTQIPVIVDDAEMSEVQIEDLLSDSSYTEKAIDEDEKESSEPVDDGLFTIVDVMPAFPGGEMGLMEYIYKNLRYPNSALKNKIENCVICTFIIDTNGLVTFAEITQSADPYLDKEALRIVKTLPKWKPAKKQGKPVRVKFTLPIVFRLK